MADEQSPPPMTGQLILTADAEVIPGSPPPEPAAEANHDDEELQR